MAKNKHEEKVQVQVVPESNQPNQIEISEAPEEITNETNTTQNRITRESLASLEKDALIEEIIKFSDGYFMMVDKYNTDINILNNNIIEKDKTSLLLKDEIILARDEIQSLKDEIQAKNLKIKDINLMIKPSANKKVIQTYFIEAYDNRIGTEQYGGGRFNLAVCVAKLEEELLSWKITINQNQFVEKLEIEKEIKLTQDEVNTIADSARRVGWYAALANFLSIPSFYNPETFGSECIFTLARNEI
jgi:hypothetical protein